MSDQTLMSEIDALLNEYTRAFAAVDGVAIARCYHAPSITMRGDGSVHVFQTRQELETFFQAVAQKYYDEGGQNARFSDLHAPDDWVKERSCHIGVASDPSRRQHPSFMVPIVQSDLRQWPMANIHLDVSHLTTCQNRFRFWGGGPDVVSCWPLAERDVSHTARPARIRRGPSASFVAFDFHRHEARDARAHRLSPHFVKRHA